MMSPLCRSLPYAAPDSDAEAAATSPRRSVVSACPMICAASALAGDVSRTPPNPSRISIARLSSGCGPTGIMTAIAEASDTGDGLVKYVAISGRDAIPAVRAREAAVFVRNVSPS